MHSFRAGCSIQFDEFVIITGGIKDCDNDDCTNPRVDSVSKYNIDGWVEYLPSLNTARSGNGCGHYINSNEEVVNLYNLTNKKYSSDVTFHPLNEKVENVPSLCSSAFCPLLMSDFIIPAGGQATILPSVLPIASVSKINSSIRGLV